MNEPVGGLSVKHLAKRLSQDSLFEGDAAAILRDVILLAEGTWHDSLTPYPTVYTAENLAKFAVMDNTGYKVHAFERGMDDEIGEAENIRYDESKKAILTDLVFHGATQASRDVLAAIKRRHSAGKPAYVSIEMMTRDVPTEQGMEAQDITITGWIATAVPACKKCAIPKQQTDHKPMTENLKANEDPNPEETGKVEEQDISLKDLLTRVTALEEALKEKEKTLSDTEKHVEAIKTLTETINSLKTAQEASDKRVKALEENGTKDRIPLIEKTRSEVPIVEYNTNPF